MQSVGQNVFMPKAVFLPGFLGDERVWPTAIQER